MQDLHTLFEDEHILAIHKPDNIPFHSDDEGQGVVRLVRETYQSEALFPIHRLDRMTSGLMIFAKSSTANEALSHQLEQKQVEKYYLAVASNKPKKKQGTVKGDMAKSRRGSFKLLRESNNPAITRFFSRSLPLNHANLWAFILKPETGKTHQLRVALKSLGTPILGDKRYGGEAASRGFLHAFCMRFELFGQLYDIKDTNLEANELSFEDLESAFSELNCPQSFPWGKKAFLLAQG